MYFELDTDSPAILNSVYKVINYILFFMCYAFWFTSRNTIRHLKWDLFFLSNDLFEIQVLLKKLRKDWKLRSYALDVTKESHEKHKLEIKKIIEKRKNKDVDEQMIQSLFDNLTYEEKESLFALKDKFAHKESLQVSCHKQETFVTGLITLRQNYEDLIDRTREAINLFQITGIMKKMGEEDLFRRRINEVFQRQFDVISSVKDKRFFLNLNGNIQDSDDSIIFDVEANQNNSELEKRFLEDMFPDLKNYNRPILHQQTQDVYVHQNTNLKNRILCNN